MLLTRAGEPLRVKRAVQIALHERFERVVEGDGGVAGDVGILDEVLIVGNVLRGDGIGVFGDIVQTAAGVIKVAFVLRGAVLFRFQAGDFPLGIAQLTRRNQSG